MNWGGKKKQPESFSSARMLRTLENYPALGGSLQQIQCKFHSRTSNEHSDAVASRLGLRHLTVAVLSFTNGGRKSTGCTAYFNLLPGAM